MYFSALEAVQNAARHGCASHITVTITDGEGRIAFEVSDNGPGFEPATVARGVGLHNIEDRVRALGGDVAIASAPGHGSTLTGWIPEK